ncbi:MAG TPA: alpha/beta hydrolase [Gemmatimonadaceae bacterium]|nr:alpha/beta hydrolase [Gemmatimonadaceae bacterium]
MIETEPFELTRERPGGGKPLVVRGEAYHPESAPSTPHTVVICHGFKGFAHWAFFPYLAGEIAESGMRAITFDFSGSGVGPDRENFSQLDEFTTNTFTQELTDLDQVVAEAHRRGWIENGFGLFGHSRGGGVAILHTSHDRNVKALVTWASISSTFRWSDSDVAAWRQRGYNDIHNSRTGQNMRLGTAILDEVESLGKTKLDISSAARRIAVPWLIVHGEADETVPVKEGELLHEMSPGRSTLWTVEGGNHGFGASHPVTNAPSTLALVTSGTVKFFAEHLGSSTV